MAEYFFRNRNYKYHITRQDKGIPAGPKTSWPLLPPQPRTERLAGCRDYPRQLQKPFLILLLRLGAAELLVPSPQSIKKNRSATFSN